MAATLIRLKLRLLANALTRSPWTIVGVVLGLVYGLSVVGAVSTALSTAHGLDAQMRLGLSALCGTVAMLTWTLVPALVTSSGGGLDPRALQVFGIPRPVMRRGLVLGGLVSVPAVLTLMWLISHVMLWRSEPAGMLTAALTAPLILLQLAVLGQAVTAAVAAWFGGRRSREVFGLVAIVVLIGLGPALSGLSMGLGDALRRVVVDAGGVLAWTPLGATAALPYDAAVGNLTTGVARLAISLATLLAAAALLDLALRRIAAHPHQEAPSTGGPVHGTGLFARLPTTPAGAIAARALIYWRRDARYGTNLLMVPLFVVLALIQPAEGSSWMLYGATVVIALLLGLSISADLSYDHTAFSLHVVSGVRGIDDRIGRAAALLAFTVPLVLLLSALPALIGDAQMSGVALTAALGIGVLLTTVGVSSVTSARFLYPVPKPGESPMKTPPGMMGRSFAITYGAMLLITLLMSPEIVLWVIRLIGGASWPMVLLWVLAPLKGALVLVLGLRLGAKILDAGLPEVFQRLRSHA